ncbi:MAG: hypothetical protein AAFW87_04205 [Pseudomonadota bacterium]
MLKLLKKFAASDDGAVTVDWVVLTAAVVGLGGGAIQAVSSGTGALGSSVSTSVATSSVGTP